MKILIVDDDEDTRMLIELMVADFGYSVEGAVNGVQGLEQARRSRPDLIISDVMMPEMDGFMFCRKIKEDTELKKTPFILYTATRAELNEEALALKLGAARFVRKPIDLKVLKSTIAEELEKSGSSARNSADEMASAGDWRLDKTYMEVLSKKLQTKSLDLESALKELARSEDMYRRLVENTPDIVYSSSATRGLIYCSPKVEGVFGYPPDFLLKNPFHWKESVHPEDQSRVRGWQAGAGAGKCFDVEYRVRTAGGEWRWLRDRSVVRTGEGGEEVTDGIAADITGRRQAEEKLRESQERLLMAQKLDTVGQLSGGVAHDLNNLLGPIMGYAEFLGGSLSAYDPRQKDIGEIIKAADRAARLIRQLMAFGRTQLLQPKVVDINCIISSAVRMLERIIGEQFRLVLDLNPEIGMVKIDPGQFEQAIVNLVVAARDAMPQGGIISIGTCCLETLCPEAGEDFLPGPYVMMSVKDSGPGMDEAARGRIFEPFFATKNPGSGLRLSTVHGIVKQSGGEIRVESSPGKGSVFKVYLPRNEEE
jgi:PAS domain S-box-containing protein